jgi:hypothetical protein
VKKAGIMHGACFFSDIVAKKFYQIENISTLREKIIKNNPKTVDKNAKPCYIFSVILALALNKC